MKYHFTRSNSMKLQPRFLYWWLLRSKRNVRPKQRQISFLIVFILFRKKKTAFKCMYSIFLKMIVYFGTFHMCDVRDYSSLSAKSVVIVFHDRSDVSEKTNSR